MGTLNESIDGLLKTLQKKKMENLGLDNYCIICDIPKDDVNSLTCGHPQCINTVLECVADKSEFSRIAEENGIHNPHDLKEYFEKVEDLRQKMELVFRALNVKDLQETLDEIQSAIQKLENK